MLGKTISDPENTECSGEIHELKLSDTHTFFGSTKMQRQSSGIIAVQSEIFKKLSEASAYGYEIHIGRTQSNESALIQLSDGNCDGTYRNNTFGTYLHGIFDSSEISSAIISELFEHHDLLNYSDVINHKEYKESQYNLLADILHQNFENFFIMNTLL